MQAQLWRMWWLTAAMAALALGLCALNLGACSARERLSLALLALAWALAQEAGLYAPLVAALAFALDRLSGLKISDEIGRAFWLGAGVAVIAPLAVDLPSLQLFGGLFQPDFAPAMMPLVLKFAGPPLLFGAVALAAFGLPDALAARVWRSAPRRRRWPLSPACSGTTPPRSTARSAAAVARPISSG